MTVVASGGDKTLIDGYYIHTFRNSGTLTVYSAGDVEVLVVAGGGGGGPGVFGAGSGGGGGAGGLTYNATLPVGVGSVTVTVGTGGTGGTAGAAGTKGGSSIVTDGNVSFSTITTLGGGVGHIGNEGAGGGGLGEGGSGGGGSFQVGSSGTVGQGNNGGNPSFDGAGGGGGAGAVGGNGSSPQAGDGGVGLAYSISGISAYYAGGGGGSNEAVTAGTGGLGGGGNGVGSNGEANTGGGGGGGVRTGSQDGGDGGSGVVIFRYATSLPSVRAVAQNEDLADMAEARFKGRKAAAGTGIPQDMTAAEAITALGGPFVSPVSPSVVDNIVSFADITGGQKDSGIPLASITANTFLRGPTSGAAGAASWGALVAADMPAGVALLATANVFTTLQKINVNSARALVVEQDGVKDDVLVVDTASGYVLINGGNGSTKAVQVNGAMDFNNGMTINLGVGAYFPAWINMPTTGSSGIGSGGVGGNPWITYIGHNGDYFNSAVTGDIGYRNTAGRMIWGLSASGTPVGMVLSTTGLFVGGYDAAAKLHILDDVAATATITEVTRIQATSTGTVAANFGNALGLWLETSTASTSKQSGRLWSKWVVPTNGSETSALGLDAYSNSTAQEFISGQGDAGGVKLSFYAGTRVARGAALTTQLTTLTFTAPGTPDYALQDLIDSSAGACFGFATKDEGNTALSTIANLQTRVAELEARLGSATGVNLFA